MTKEKYQLFGSISFFDKKQEVVHPVFYKDKKFYLQVVEMPGIISDFQQITDDEHLALIQPLKGPNLIIGDLPEAFVKGGEALIGFRENEDTFFFGNLDSFQKYIKNVPIDDELVEDEIKSMQPVNKKQYRKTRQNKTTF